MTWMTNSAPTSLLDVLTVWYLHKRFTVAPTMSLRNPCKEATRLELCR